MEQRQREHAMVGQLTDWADAQRFMLAGDAYVTLRSKETGTRYTYRVSKADCLKCGKGEPCTCGAKPRYFVSLLTGPDNEGDYTYLGMIFPGNGAPREFRATKATGTQATGKPFLAFAYAWRALERDQSIPAKLEIWHEGRCGRCGRTLTVPESIA